MISSAETRNRLVFVGLACFVLGAAVTVPALAQNEQFIPMVDYRVGPYAAGGTGTFGGFIDYLDMLNKRDGGINGVKLTWEECETEYKNDRGVECYERLKKKGPTGAAMFNFVSTGITYACIERATADKIPVVSIGYGRADASDGRVFPYVFPLVTNYWSQNTAKIKFIGMKEGGMDKLKGKKIVNLYHGSAFGKETIRILDLQAKKYGFTVTHIEVAHPGNEQESQWLQIRQLKPDWVILRGWGVMNPVALKTAAKVGYPRDHIVGFWWSGAEEDVIPAGDAAKNYISAAFHPSGTDFPVLQDVKKYVYSGGPQGEPGGLLAFRLDLLQPGHHPRHPEHRGDPHGAGEVRQEAADRRAGALGTGEPEHRREAPEGARRRWTPAADQALLHGPRGGRRGQVPAMGRDEMEGDHRLDQVGPVDRPTAGRGVGGRLRQGEGDHAP